MIIVLMMVALLILVAVPTIVLSVVWKDYDVLHSKGKAKFVLKAVSVVVLAVTIVICVFAIGLSCATSTYNVLEQRYEFIQETYMVYKTHTRIDGNAWLQEIYDYNQKVYTLKARASNPWTSWFVNKKRAEGLKVVEFENGILKQGA